MRAYDVFWMKNEEWYIRKNGIAIIKDDAPQEAQDSFVHYLEQKGITREQLAQLIDAPIEFGGIEDKR